MGGSGDMSGSADKLGAGSIGLAPEQFDAAFPFHLAVDRRLAILQAGHTLRRVCPDVMPGAELGGLFSLKRPAVPLGFDALKAADRAVFLWQHRGSGMVLRGQIIPAADGEALVFLGSPWLADNGELARHGLMIEDFALHDPVVDLLQVVQAHKTAFEDLRSLTEKLSAQRAELRHTNDELNRRIQLHAEAQAQLQESEAETRKLALIASLTDNGVVLTDTDGRVEWVNDGFVKITGYTLEDIVGKTPGSVLQGEKTDPSTVARMREHLARREGFTAQVLNYGKSGRENWLLIEVRPMKDEAGSVTGYMAIQRDITLRKQAEQALIDAKREAEAANHAKSAFLAAMSHEIRSPMNAVLGTLELLRSSSLDGDQQLWVKAAHESAHALLKIIDDILDFSKIEAGHLILEEIGFNLGSLLGDIVQLFRPRAEAKQLALTLSVAPETPVALKGDPFRLRQIIINLIGNAVKFTDRGGISVSVAPVKMDDAHVLLEFHVRDTGIGIPEQAAESLFHEFVQLEAESSRHYGGTGLGLAISKRLVDLMGGEIGLTSEVGRGSDFWLRLGLALDHSSAGRPESAEWAAEPAGANLGRILLAEDGEVNRLVIATMLRKSGYTVVAVNDGQAALETLQREPFDMVLMDVQMPVMDGLHAARAIRALPGKGAAIPILALTANALMENRDACLAAGMDDFITKPVERKRLMASVSHWLRNRSAAPDTGGDQASAGPPPVLDRDVLRKLADNTDEAVVRETVRIFFDECVERLGQMIEALSSGDLGSAQRQSHTIGSGALLIGAMRLGATAAELEEACRRGEMANLALLAERAQTDLDDTRQACAALVDMPLGD
jgi:PAS domain S-box-containing protein